MEVFVATDGNDDAAGTMEAPLRTLSGALRFLNRQYSQEPATVWLRGGVYQLEQTFIITEYDYQHITFSSWPGEEAIITGAQAVNGWLPEEHFGQTIWKIRYDGRPIRALYGEDGARRLSRWPKEGFLQAAAPYKQTDSKFDKQMALYINPGDVPEDLRGASLRLLHLWKDEITGVRRYAPANGQLELNRPMSMTVEKGDRYFLENVLSVPLEAGEWAFDQENGYIYYAPMQGETIWKTPLYAGVLQHLVFIYNASDITFENITFRRNNWEIPWNDQGTDFPQAAYDAAAAILLYESEDIRFTRCTFQDIGATCIRVDYATTGVIVTESLFKDIGAHAFYVHGDNTTNESVMTQDIVFENNHVDHYGMNLYNAAAVLIIHARNASIAHNEIHGGTYTAISAGWVWGAAYNVTDNIRVSNNLIYNVGQRVLSDMGAIYLLGRQPNTVVSGNVIHDISAADYGGWGIYLDEGSSGILVTNNLVYRCTAQGFHQHMGTGNVVRNNIFALNHEGQVGISGKGDFVLESNLLVGGKPYLQINEGGIIKQRKNIQRTDSAMFVDADMENFALREDPVFAENGFVPWVHMAGRYQVLD